MTHSTLLEIAPQDVHQVVARHLLVDAFDFVFDLEKSQGAWLHDSKSAVEAKIVEIEDADKARQSLRADVDKFSDEIVRKLVKV